MISEASGEGVWPSVADDSFRQLTALLGTPAGFPKHCKGSNFCPQRKPEGLRLWAEESLAQDHDLIL